ncbi:glycoside hydrolase family 31 protein [Amanita muscaria Koide BX008]|uniref:Glycoside hydrolase family 31 protein n=1 Tax=Amanita muscaria (strain Koide BX008) TaxID=946122 RepID=A0A0C2VZA4_AMAMK|nr:glycoside hydrolase family 31 protein [Amanita muscaria Koide BX008]
MHARPLDSTVGLYNAITSDIISHSSEDSTETHWISESGILDLFLMAGPTPEQCSSSGTISSDDIRTVQKRFDEEDMPMDVFWLGIEYSEEHKYFI